MLLVNEKINFGEEEISSVQYNDEKINAKYIFRKMFALSQSRLDIHLIQLT